MESFSGVKTVDNEGVSNNNNEDSLQDSKVSRKHKQDSKQQNLGTRIPVSTHKRFLQFVLAKYGKINGVFSQEVTKALESWIDKQQQTTSCTFSSSNSGKPRADKVDKLRRIAMQLKQLNSFPDVNPFTIKHTIENVLGQCDKRTLNSYLFTIKKLSKPSIHSSGIAMIDVTKFIEKIQRDDW